MTLLNPAKSINRAPLRRALLLIALALVLGSGGWLITPALATDPVGVTTTILSGPISFDAIGVHFCRCSFGLDSRARNR